MLLLPPLRSNCPDEPEHLKPSPRRCTGEVADARIRSSASDAPDPKITKEKTIQLEELFSKRPKILVTRGELDLQSQRELYKRLVRFRINAHKLLNGKFKDILGDDLPAFLEDTMPANELQLNVEHFFSYLAEGECDPIDWYFDIQCKSEGLGDYPRLVLGNSTPIGLSVYKNWQLYRSLFTTYEMDKDYVKFFAEISTKLEWLKLGVRHPERSDEWLDIYWKGAYQALEIAIKYTHMNCALVYTAYKEYIWYLRFDYNYREDMDRLFFEIWKHVTHGQITFENALTKLLREKSFPRHEDLMLFALEKDTWSDLEDIYNSCVEGIPDDASEDNVKKLIRAAVWELYKPKEPLHQYMTKKMFIAESIGLVNRPI